MNYKCLHIITRLANGGAEETVFDLILQLAERGIYCDLGVGKECAPEIVKKYSLPKQCTMHHIPHLVRNPHPYNELVAIREIRKLIRDNNYTIVQTHGSKAGVLGRIAAHKEKVPVIIGMIHGISFPPAMNIVARTLYKMLEQYTATLSNSLVCVGEDMKQQYIDARIGTSAQYRVIYTGMNLEPFRLVAIQRLQEYDTHTHIYKEKACSAFNLPHDKIIIGSIGRLEDRKNQKALIAMMPTLLSRDSNIHLCLIGDGPNEDMLEKLVQSLHLEDHVSFLGYVPRVWEVLPALDIHCMVSLWEGLPRVLVQTSAAGIPNICYQVDGAWEIIKHDYSGYIISRDDSIDFVDKVCTLVNDNTKRIQFGSMATELADERWSLEAFASHTQALYDSLMHDAYQS